MKPPFPIAPPRRANGTLLPALLAAVLAAMLALQLALTAEVELPSAGPSGLGTAHVPPPAIRPVPIPPVLAARPLFTPGRPGAAPADPLGGAVVAGEVRIGRRAYAVVQQGGRTVNVPVGGSVAGWRLAGLSGEGARFVRGSERVTVAYGAPVGGGADVEETGESEGE